VQRLTASVVQAAADLEIPYFVTAHDAWWISDHQFLVNSKGIECDYQQSDPLVAAQDVEDVTESIQRRLYLRKQLGNAVGVLAVSETFAELYRRNGFPQTKANRNGLQPKPATSRQPSKSGRVRLAHIGGMAAHKGYFLFKDAVEAADLSNTEIVVINHAQSPGTTEYSNWNGTPVTFLAKFKQEEINKLYSMIDVLVAPSMWPESFGLVTREATAAGVWVVTSDKGAIGEDIIPEENGHICSVEDATDLIAALIEIDENFERYQTVNAKLKQTRTTASQVEELEHLFKGVLIQTSH
jgi:glycosyltransferase involved in cell wall biosynthesis